MCKYLFVYGTLRPAIVREELRWLIEMLKPIGRATVRGRLYDLGEYPGAVLDPQCHTLVVGDLLELPANEQIVAALDEYEGCVEGDPDASLFVRSRCWVRLDDGREIESWIYLYNRDVSSATLIPKGDYVNAYNHKDWEDWREG
ncbi:MAG: gamma-glutamylcyclotransferase family protein [Blastocatellia bacterium]